jgi:hypothetical protein
LWNYQIVYYTNSTNDTAGPVCIGTYGNSIKSTTEYYTATATNSAPNRYSSGTTIDLLKWKTSIADCGQSVLKPYVWNFERVSYTLDGDKDTEVTLLTSSPRTIQAITEYYCIVSDNSTPSSPTFNNTTHNFAPTIPEGWSTTRPAMAPGDTLWNFEVIQYNAADSEGKNVYEVSPVSAVAYAGTNGEPGPEGKSPFIISLDETFIGVPSTNGGATTFPASGYTITPTVFQGASQFSDWSTSETSGYYITITTNSVGAAWDGKIVKFTSLSANSGSVIFTLYYKESAASAAEKLAETSFNATKVK